MTFPNKQEVERVRQAYPIGSVVEIISMSDLFTDMPSGTMGVVNAVDSTGTVFARWTNGSGLGAVYGEDTIRKVTRKSDIIKTECRLVSRLKNAPNMFDKTAVFELAIENNYLTLADFIFTHTDLYSALILTGELPPKIDTEEGETNGYD